MTDTTDQPKKRCVSDEGCAAPAYPSLSDAGEVGGYMNLSIETERRTESLRVKNDFLLSRFESYLDLKKGYEHFELSPCLSLEELASVEDQIGTVLPKDYAAFLLSLGNGSVSPSSGIYSVEYGLKMNRGKNLRLPFLHTKGWQPESPEDKDGEQKIDFCENRLTVFTTTITEMVWTDWYFSDVHLNGCLPVMNMGYQTEPVIHGSERGNLWEDVRACDVGLVPVTLYSKRVSFLDWYEHGLNGALQVIGENI